MSGFQMTLHMVSMRNPKCENNKISGWMLQLDNDVWCMTGQLTVPDLANNNLQ